MFVQKSQRLTVRSHNIEFLKTLAFQMGITDLSEVLNYLLLDVKGLSYKFGDKPAPQPQQSPSDYGFDISNFELAAPISECDRNKHNHVEIDPVISRLANLIEEF